MPPRTWSNYVKANYGTEKPNHPDTTAIRRALGAQWANVKPPTKAERLATKRAAAARRRQNAVPPPPTPPPERAGRGDDDIDMQLMVSPYDMNVLAAAEHRPDGAMSSWRGGWGLKAGKVVLWIRFDDTNSIVERRVVKTVQVERHLWLDPTIWDGDVKDYQTRLPMDYVLQRKLCTATDGGIYFNRVRACMSN